MKVVVIGSTGVLGRQLLPRLFERGHQVRAIVRSQEQRNHLSRLGFEAVLGDIFDLPSLESAVTGCQAAIHIATAVPRPGMRPDYSLNDRIRREGTVNFIQACRAGGVERYLQQSIALVYGDQGSKVVDENTRPVPLPINQSAIDMEAVVMDTPLDWIILRGGLFYGPGTGRDQDWRQAAQAGRLRTPGDGSGLASLTHVIDMAAAMVLALEKAPAGRTYNVVDDCPVDFLTLYRHVAALESAGDPLTGGPPEIPSLACSNQKIKKELGWSPFFSTYHSGLA